MQESLMDEGPHEGEVIAGSSCSPDYSLCGVKWNLASTAEKSRTNNIGPCSPSVRQDNASEGDVTASFVDIRVSSEELAAVGASTGCERCNRAFDNLNALRMHLVKTHNVVRSDADSRLFHRTPNLQKVFSCVERRYYCPVKECRYNGGARYFSAYKLLHQHYKKVHMKKSLRCAKCNTSFSLQRDLTYHEKRRCAVRDDVTAKTLRRSREDNCATALRKRYLNKSLLNGSHASSQKLAPAVVMRPLLILNVHHSVLVHRSPPISRVINRVDVYTQTENAWTDAALNEYGFRSSGVDGGGACAQSSCSVSAQTTSLPPIDSIAFNSMPIYEQNDFHCQTSPLGSVEFGTQMYEGDEMCFGEYSQFEEDRKEEDGASTCLPFCVNCANAPAPMQSSSHLHADACIEACPDVRSCSSAIEEREFRHAETHVDELDFDEFLRHIQTQTCDTFASDALTQTANDFIDSSCMTDWDAL
ncbi:ATM interactor [Toxocara canis]|uniref:ATM interactor n=1 Tax=Toxocara canis TaxID=6265 RepID=A0A0B2VFR3_TOXCA|nr:ATM interactor [Toxocara canis]